MKSLKFLFLAVLVAAVIPSCNDVNWDNVEGLNYEPTTFNKSKDYRGGNVDCSQLEMAGLVETTGRNNYNNGAFENSWPEGLEVKVEDGKYVSFYVFGSLKIGEKCYKVGAVIVKGGDASNVYYYEGGVTGDKNLVAPNNSSGGPAGLSNLTFCFVEVECEKQPEWVIGLKTIITSTETPWAYAYSGGLDIPGRTGGAFIGYNNYIFGSDNIYPLLYGFGNDDQIGTITARDYMEDNIHYIEVIIDTYSEKWSFLESYLYVGTMDGLKKYVVLFPDDGQYYVNYNYFPFYNAENAGIRTFKIPFSEINE